MATLGDLRNVVRTQAEVDSSELPNSTIDWYLRQAFDRTINMVPRWPFYETSWQMTCPAGQNYMDQPPDLDRPTVRSLVDLTSLPVEHPLRLRLVDHNNAQSAYLHRLNNYGFRSVEFSLWEGDIFLWPHVRFAEERKYVLEGNRRPSDWISQGEAAVVDADERLHWPLAHYAIALTYAQQEDDTLENMYMTRWQMDVNSAVGAIMRPHADQPLRMGGGVRTLTW